MLIDTSCHAFGLPLAVLLLSFPSCPCGDRPALDPGSDSALRSFVSSFFCNSFHRIPLQPSLRFKVRCCSCSSTTLFLSCMFEIFFPSNLSIAGVWYTCYFVIWSCVWNARNHNVNETEKQRKTHTNPEENILASKDLFLVVHVQVNINAGRPYSHLMSTTTHSKVSSLSRLANCLTWHLLILPCHYFVSTWP